MRLHRPVHTGGRQSAVGQGRRGPVQPFGLLSGRLGGTFRMTDWLERHSSPGYGDSYVSRLERGYWAAHWTHLEKPALLRQMESCRHQGAQRVLDVACGTGRIMSVAAEVFDAPIGADASEPMLVPRLCGPSTRRTMRRRSASVLSFVRCRYRFSVYVECLPGGSYSHHCKHSLRNPNYRLVHFECARERARGPPEWRINCIAGFVGKITCAHYRFRNTRQCYGMGVSILRGSYGWVLSLGSVDISTLWQPMLFGRRNSSLDLSTTPKPGFSRS